jgi:diguanylate cyclase (GGDEF)-like protein
VGGIGGDRHIHHAAQVLAASVRTGDVLARLGGDEFWIIAVGASPTQTGELACRVEGALRRDLQSASRPPPIGKI